MSSKRRRSSTSSGVNFHRFVGLAMTLLQPFRLLRAGDVQQDLDDRRALVGEHALELADVPVAPAPHGRGLELVHPHGDHVLVVGAVPDADLAARGTPRVHPPQVVVREVGRARLREVLDPAAMRVEPREDMPDGAVLAGGVGALQHHEQAAAALGPQPVLQVAQLGHIGIEAVHPVEPEPGGGVALGQVGGMSGFDAELGEHAHTAATGFGRGSIARSARSISASGSS